MSKFDRNLADINTRNKVVSRLLQTPEGRDVLAATMIQPLRERRDYASVGRKAFLVQPLPDGALPIFDLDPDVNAFIVGEEGQNILSLVKPERVIFPLFELASAPITPLTQVKERRYDVLKRSQDLGKAEIQAEEDIRVFEVFDAIAADNTLIGINPDIAATAPVTPPVFADAYARIETNDNHVARIFMNAMEYADIRKFGRDILDIETQKILLNTGLLATLWGAQIIVSRIIPVGSIYVTAEPEFVGRIPVRTELTVLSADDPINRAIGFSIFQQIGIGSHNNTALQKIRVCRTAVTSCTPTL